MQNPQQIKEKLIKKTELNFPLELLLFYWMSLIILDFFYKLNTMGIFFGLFYINESLLGAPLMIGLIIVVYGGEYLFILKSPDYVDEKLSTLLLFILIYLITEIFIGMHCRELGISLGFIRPW